MDLEVEKEEEVELLDFDDDDKLYKAVIFGSTGSLGTGVLNALKKSRNCEKILAITRRKIEEHPKLENVIWEEFDDHLLFENDEIPENLVKMFEGYDVCFNSCGISGNKVDYEDYYKLLYTYAINLTHICSAANIKHYFYTSTMEASWRVFQYFRNGYVQNKTEEYMIENFVNSGMKNITFIKPPLIMDDTKSMMLKACVCCCNPVLSYLINPNMVIHQTVYGKGVINCFEEDFYEDLDDEEDDEDMKTEFSTKELWGVQLNQYGKQ